MRSVELLHRARLAGYTGGKSAVYALAQTLRVRAVTPLVRFEGLPGEFSQHDFGEVWVTYQDGTETKVHFFASRNPTFAGVALDLGIGVEVCWPYRPQEKGTVDNLVGCVKGSFFKQRRFLDRADLERQLRERLTEANTIRPVRGSAR